MQKGIAAILIIVLLSGCSVKEEEPVQEIPSLSAQAEEYTMEQWHINSFSLFCGYSTTPAGLNVHPFFNKEPHIEIRCINLSGKPFLEYMSTCLPNSKVSTFDNDINLVSDGTVTYGYRVFESHAIIAYTDTLPKGYVKLALENTCYDL